jgi:hypothetical protein
MATQTERWSEARKENQKQIDTSLLGGEGYITITTMREIRRLERGRVNNSIGWIEN